MSTISNRVAPYAIPTNSSLAPYSNLINKSSMENTNVDSSSEFDEKRNLIVNYLPPTFNQEAVRALFSRVAPVTNCKLVQNFETGNSLGYAFLEYSTEKAAADAISQLNGVELQGKRLRVNYARQSSPEIKDSNVYVAGLPKWVDEKQFLSLFAPFGTVITHKLLLDTDRSSRGVGFVRYSLKSEAQDAIDSMSGKTLSGSSIALTVKLAIPPASKHRQKLREQSFGGGVGAISSLGQSGGIRFNPLAASTNPIFNNLPNLQQSPNLQQLLQNTAAAVDTSMLNLIGAANTKGTNGIVQARQNLSGQIFSLYVYGLQPTHTALTLYELFAPFGGILNVKLMRDLTKEDKPCKGFGFVNFRKYEEAYSAMLAMNGCPYDGKHLQVSFKTNQNHPTSTVNFPTLQHTLPAQTPTFNILPF